MKHVYKTLSVLALMPALAACHSDGKEKSAGTDEPVVDVAEVLVDTVTLHTTYPGYLTASKEVDLVARVDGYLTGKPFEGGEFVKAGTVLFTIESRNYADAVSQAQSSLADAEATYAYASSNYEAMKKALQSDAVSQMEVLQAKSNMEAAQAAISSARAALQQAQTTLSYCTVRAPFDGHVDAGTCDVGTYLAGSAAPVTLGKIYSDEKVTANFSITDGQLAQIEANQANPQLQVDMTRIPVTFDSKMPHSYTGNLNYMAPALDKSTGTLKLQASILNPLHELRSGMFCKIQLPNAVVPNAILVRDASIGTDQSGSYVYVVNDSNKVESRAIKTGELVADTLRVVTSGLKRGDRYVTKALLKVRDGMTVKPHVVK